MKHLLFILIAVLLCCVNHLKASNWQQDGESWWSDDRTISFSPYQEKDMDLLLKIYKNSSPYSKHPSEKEWEEDAQEWLKNYKMGNPLYGWIISIKVKDITDAIPVGFMIFEKSVSQDDYLFWRKLVFKGVHLPSKEPYFRVDSQWKKDEFIDFLDQDFMQKVFSFFLGPHLQRFRQINNSSFKGGEYRGVITYGEGEIQTTIISEKGFKFKEEIGTFFFQKSLVYQWDFEGEFPDKPVKKTNQYSIYFYPNLDYLAGM